MNMRGIVFDLDGTLVDTLPDIMHALNLALRDCGRPMLPPEMGNILIGNGARSLVEKALAPDGASPAELETVFARFMEHYGAGSTANSRVYDGVVGQLREFAEASIAMAVCTNKPGAISEKVLSDLGLTTFFRVIIGGDALPVRKPDGEHLLAAIAGAGAVADEVVMVGDSPADVGAARNAGVPVIVVDYGYSQTPARDLGADAVISRFTELPAAIAALSGG